MMYTKRKQAHKTFSYIVFHLFSLLFVCDDFQKNYPFCVCLQHAIECSRADFLFAHH